MTTYYDSHDSTFKPIPRAAWYVLSNDKFMSGFGPAKGMTNTCVVPCESYDQAWSVLEYVRTRSEQKYVRIAKRVIPRDRVLYSICDGWKTRAKEMAQ